MNIASLELCKELYELSGWDDNFLPHEVYSTPIKTIHLPVYSLGYLLRQFEQFKGDQFVHKLA